MDDTDSMRLNISVLNPTRLNAINVKCRLESSRVDGSGWILLAVRGEEGVGDCGLQFRAVMMDMG